MSMHPRCQSSFTEANVAIHDEIVGSIIEPYKDRQSAFSCHGSQSATCRLLKPTNNVDIVHIIGQPDIRDIDTHLAPHSRFNPAIVTACGKREGITQRKTLHGTGKTDAKHCPLDVSPPAETGALQ
ncbi:MAG: hypothetical protein Q7T32_07960 [Moraxellaceae bacterium]|nr:hypothetical protein [Moraxellaceae bacterium]